MATVTRLAAKAATRAALLEAAAYCFISRGWARTAVRDITVRAERPASLLYDHFPGGMAELWVEAMGRAVPDPMKLVALWKGGASRAVAERFIKDWWGSAP